MGVTPLQLHTGAAAQQQTSPSRAVSCVPHLILGHLTTPPGMRVSQSLGHPAPPQISAPSSSLAAPVRGLLEMARRCTATVRNFFVSARREVLSPSPVERRPAPQDFNATMHAFTDGFLPNFNDPNQLKAFQIYLAIAYPQGNRETSPDAIDCIRRVQKRFADRYAKLPLPGIKVDRQQLKYPTPALLTELVQDLQAVTKELHHKFLKPEGIVKLLSSTEVFSDNAERMILADYIRETDFERRIHPPKGHSVERPENQKLIELFKVFEDISQKLETQRLHCPALSKCLAEIPMLSAVSDPLIAFSLQDKRPLVQAHAVRQVVALADEFVVQRGYPDVEGVIQRFQINEFPLDKAPGVLRDQINTITSEITQGAVAVQGRQDSFTIRPLSAVEAGYRGVLGLDCSSRTYFGKALEPTFHFYTLTNIQGHSAGHVTIALGEAKDSQGKWKKVAFLDKVQNIEFLDLPVVLEGVRKALASKGYILGIHPEPGDQINGVSNDVFTRSALKAIATQAKPEQALYEFTPHLVPTELESDPGHSRAYGRLPVVPIVSPNSAQLQGVELTLTEEHASWSVDSLDIEKVCEQTIKLMEGSDDDKLRFISSALPVELVARQHRASSTTSPFEPLVPDLPQLLSAWIGDKDHSEKLRRTALEALIQLEPGDALKHLVAHIEEKEHTNLIQNWQQTPRLWSKLKPFSMELAHIVGQRKNSQNLYSLILQELRLEELFTLYCKGEVANLRDPMRTFVVQTALPAWKRRDEAGFFIKNDYVATSIERLEKFRLDSRRNRDSVTAGALLASFLRANGDTVSLDEKRDCLRDLFRGWRQSGLWRAPDIGDALSNLPEGVLESLRATYTADDYQMLARAGDCWNNLLDGDTNFQVYKALRHQNPQKVFDEALGRNDSLHDPVLSKVADYVLKEKSFQKPVLQSIFKNLKSSWPNLPNDFGDAYLGQLSMTLTQQERVIMLEAVTDWSSLWAPKLIRSMLAGATYDTAEIVRDSYLPLLAKEQSQAASELSAYLRGCEFLHIEQMSEEAGSEIETSISTVQRTYACTEEWDDSDLTQTRKSGPNRLVVSRLNEAERAANHSTPFTHSARCILADGSKHELGLYNGVEFFASSLAPNQYMFEGRTFSDNPSLFWMEGGEAKAMMKNPGSSLQTFAPLQDGTLVALSRTHLLRCGPQGILNSIELPHQYRWRGGSWASVAPSLTPLLDGKSVIFGGNDLPLCVFNGDHMISAVVDLPKGCTFTLLKGGSVQVKSDSNDEQVSLRITAGLKLA